jgi:phage terminase small subunit
MMHPQLIDDPITEVAAQKQLTAQEIRFVTLVMRGIRPNTAGQQAGYGQNTGSSLMKQPHIAATIERLREAVLQGVGLTVTRENLTVMLFESHAKAATATEEVTAIREIAKINGIYDQKITVRHEGVPRLDQLERLSTEELLKRSELGLESLLDEAEDADFESI